MSATRKHVTGARSEDLHSAARRIYDASGQHAATAEQAIIGELRRRPALQEQAFALIASQLVNRIIATDRSKILAGLDTGYVEPPAAPANDTVRQPYERSAAAVKASADRLRAVSVKLTGIYLAKFKFNGEEFTLGRATPEQLRPVAAHHMTQGATMVRMGRFLERVIAGAKEGQPIYKSITLRQLEAMQKEALESEV
jgi:hypothetical protein